MAWYNSTMTINAISDIHASVDPSSGKIIYGLPARHSLEELSGIASKLREAAGKAFQNQIAWKENVVWRIDSEKYASLSTFLDRLSEAAEEARIGFAGIQAADACDFFQVLVAASNGARNILAKSKKLPQARKIALADVSSSASLLKNDFAKLAMAFKPELLKPADYLVVAGDLATMDCYREAVADLEKRTAGKFKKILAIPGNHDYWLGDVSGRIEDLHGDWTRCEWVDGDVVFLGCTLWTPVSRKAFSDVKNRMNDYRFIPSCYSPETTSKLYAEQRNWLEKKLEEHAGKKAVVFTHHSPFRELASTACHSNWDALLDEAYVVSDGSLDDVGKRGNVALWICGHTHENFDGELHGIHVFRNPIGYGSLVGYFIPENCSGRWYNSIKEI